MIFFDPSGVYDYRVCFPDYTKLMVHENMFDFTTHCAVPSGFEIGTGSYDRPAPINKKQTPCFTNQYYDVNGNCLWCHSDCLTCDDGNACTSCSFDGKVLDGTGTCICPQGTYEDSINQLCTCHDFCAACAGPTSEDCIGDSCATGYDQISQPDSNGKFTCGTCHDFCAACAGPTSDDCIGDTCATGYAQIGQPDSTGKFTCGCPEALFYDETTNSCVSCHPTCDTCSDPKYTSCLTCPLNTGK